MKSVYKIAAFVVLAALIMIISTACVSNKTADPNDQAAAYFTIFEYLYGSDSALNSDTTYLALDLTEVMLSDTEPLITLIQGFCNENGYILMLDTIEGLTEKGYIEDLHFENGFVIKFKDIKLTSNELITSASKWRSGLGAIGADYTVKRNNNLSPTWDITNTENNWIS